MVPIMQRASQQRSRFSPEVSRVQKYPKVREQHQQGFAQSIAASGSQAASMPSIFVASRSEDAAF